MALDSIRSIRLTSVA